MVQEINIHAKYSALQGILRKKVTVCKGLINFEDSLQIAKMQFGKQTHQSGENIMNLVQNYLTRYETRTKASIMSNTTTK